MAGTTAGGVKAAETNKRKHGASFYADIGRIGGSKGRTGGFYHSKVNGLDRHIKAGQKGGRISRRGAVVVAAPPTKVGLFNRLFRRG